MSKLNPVRIVCMSKGRHRTIGKHTLKLFPDMYVFVDEAEAHLYEPLVKKGRLHTHPGLGPIETSKFLVDWQDDEGADCAYIGDDTTGLYAMPGWSGRRYYDPDVAYAVVQNACENAREAGAYLFGFAANSNPIVFEPYRPLHLSRWVASPFGVRHGHGLEFDARLHFMADVDWSLQSLMKHRILWCDRRWAFVGFALNNAGGNAGFRSPEKFERERQVLKEKWGSYIRFNTEAMHSSERYKLGLPATTYMTYVYVPRQQPGY